MTAEVDGMANELFETVETHQQRGFISDGMGVLGSKVVFLTTVQEQLNQKREVVRMIEDFLYKYGKPNPPPNPTELP